MPLKARRFVRKMRGGAQSHMIEAEDGRFYITKFQNNPQGRRILVNESISAVFLRYLEIAHPETAVIELDEQFLNENPEVHIQLGSRHDAVKPGWHFGSCFPGDPSKLAVYDFIPDALLSKVANATHFLGALVFDKWMGNADARQSIFFRARLSEWAPGLADGSRRLAFLALMVDNGYVFDGPHWGFSESPLQGLYFRPEVYHTVTSYTDFQPWLDRVVHFPESLIDDAYKQVPNGWIEGDEEALERLLDRLLARRKRVPDLIRECARGRINPFPNWP